MLEISYIEQNVILSWLKKHVEKTKLLFPNGAIYGIVTVFCGSTKSIDYLDGLGIDIVEKGDF